MCEILPCAKGDPAVRERNGGRWKRFSHRGRQVAWARPEAGIDRHAPNLENVEIDTTHLGPGLSQEVFRIKAAHLAR
jgi:hypothetical protein